MGKKRLAGNDPGTEHLIHSCLLTAHNTDKEIKEIVEEQENCQEESSVSTDRGDGNGKKEAKDDEQKQPES